MNANPNTQKEIKQIVAILLNKYHNRDPFFIARSIGIECTLLDFNGELPAFSERRKVMLMIEVVFILIKNMDHMLGKFFVVTNLDICVCMVIIKILFSIQI